MIAVTSIDFKIFDIDTGEVKNSYFGDNFIKTSTLINN